MYTSHLVRKSRDLDYLLLNEIFKKFATIVHLQLNRHSTEHRLNCNPGLVCSILGRGEICSIDNESFVAEIIWDISSRSLTEKLITTGSRAS
jgi:hypothetical protein